MNIDVRWIKLFYQNNYKLHLITTFIFILISPSTYSEVIRTIYGLQTNVRCTAKTPYKYRIQIASFANKNNAIKNQSQLKEKSHYPVKIIEKYIHQKKVYAVVIGPIASCKEVNSIYASILSKKQENTNNRILTKRTLPTKKYTPKLVTINTKPSKVIAKDEVINWWSTSNWYLSLGGGEQFPNGSDNQKINNGSEFPSPYNVDIYSSKRNNNGIFSLSAGKVWQKNTPYFSAYSIGAIWQHLFRNNITGQITQYSDPAFLNYNYNVSVTSNVVLAYGKINILRYKQSSPYFMAGIGSAFNKTKSFREFPLENVTPRDTPGFANNSSSQFSYLLGTGLDLIATDNFSLSAGYNYLNLGSIATGYGVNTWSNEKLAIGSNSTNEFLITLNYKFNKNHMLP